MIRLFITSMLCMVLPLFCSGKDPVTDIESAKTYCDTSPLAPPEGIWEFTDDGLTVAIIKERTPDGRVSGNYEITVLHSSDGSALPGEKAGTLRHTADSHQFSLELYSARKGNILCDMHKCAARLNEANDSFEIKKPAKKITLRPTAFLPRFWRILRIQITDPTESLPNGMIKIYPSYDGNGSYRHIPRYL